MKKLYKFLFIFALITTAFFTTGCNNNDDYDKWESMVERNSLLLKVGVPAIATEDRAVSTPQTIIIGGVLFTYSDSNKGMDYYSGYLSRNIINSATSALKFQINSTVLYVDIDFFRTALSSAASGSQPNAVLSFDTIFNILTAESNGVSVEKPNTWNEAPTPDPSESGSVKLSINGDKVTAVVPNELGNVTKLYSWEIKLSKVGSSSSTTLYSGQHSEMYSITNDGNNFYFTLTEKGKANLKSFTTYMATLESAIVYTDKNGTVPLNLKSADKVFYVK